MLVDKIIAIPSILIVFLISIVAGSMFLLWIVNPPLYRQLEWKHRKVQSHAPDWFLRAIGFIGLTSLYMMLGKMLGPYSNLGPISFPTTFGEAMARLSGLLAGGTGILAALQVYGASPWWAPKISGLTRFPDSQSNVRLVFAIWTVGLGLIFIWSAATIPLKVEGPGVGGSGIQNSQPGQSREGTQ